VKKSVCIFLCIFLSACASTVATPTPSVAPQPVDSATPEISTPIAALTATLQPSRTPTPTESSQKDPGALLMEQAENARATKIAEFSVTCDVSSNRFLSPDENWLVIDCARKQNSTFEIVNQQGKRWVLELKDYVSKNSYGEIPPGDFRIENWSNDGKYLYFSPSLGLSGGGDPCISDFGGYGLYRIRLDDGKISTILPEPVSFFGYYIAFSPAGRQLAYEGGGGLIIRDLKTSDEFTTKDSGTTGNAIWSEDGTALTYVTCQSDWDGTSSSIEKSAVKIFSIQKKESKTILELEKSLLFIEDWGKNNVLTIGIQDQSYNWSERFFDLNSDKWITPTPKP
jgi:hypothetical protein